VGRQGQEWQEWQEGQEIVRSVRQAAHSSGRRRVPASPISSAFRT
jgi:hypothetical protein